MLGYSSILRERSDFTDEIKALFTALDQHGEPYCFFDGAKDIWARDYMPIKNKSGKYISFKYMPSYLNGFDELRTDFKNDVSYWFPAPVTYSDIVLDGGNIVFSPSKEKAIISDRVFYENPDYDKSVLLSELQRLLEAEIIIIPALASDMTGHADGMVRFIGENAVLGNRTSYKNGHEQKIRKVLYSHGIAVVEFPYFSIKGNSAVGCYLNYLETEKHIFLPVFETDTDRCAIISAQKICHKEIVPIKCKRIAKDGGVLNCICCEI